MVQLLPRDRFTIQTPEALQTVIERLEAHIEPPKTVRWSFDRNHAPYEGSISASGFKMRRIPAGRNSFIPEIEGHFATPPGGTTVHISLKLHPLILLFLGFWLCGWYGLTLLIWSSGGMDNHITLLFWGLPPVMLVIFWISFWVEVERTRTDLLRVILSRQPETRSDRRLLLLRGTALVLSTAFSVWFIAKDVFEPHPDPDSPETFRER